MQTLCGDMYISAQNAGALPSNVVSEVVLAFTEFAGRNIQICGGVSTQELNSFPAVAQRPPETGRFASGFGGVREAAVAVACRRTVVARMFAGRNIQLRALPRRILCEGIIGR